jgi:ribosome maturation factor RimP
LAKVGKPVEVIVEEVALPFCQERALELVGVEIVKEGANRFLRLYIDKEGGVSFDDCETISRAVDARLDELLSNPPYDFFEVSSPGLERPLKRDEDFARYVGQQVAVSTYAPIDGQKLFIGRLVGLRDGSVVVQVADPKLKGKERETAFARDQIASARLHVDF